ncbi:CopG family transcriptional regulator [Leptospira tipperaryensis]|uniref:CopG family transcriptional regulator n=1 Tax=Leptospira tipperaryensis TaxID=2564040 RepID=A0A1D7V2X2_9LEPT|nr:DUF1564 domain-containing protein [Leptospira tipperaryensis]AOP36170.1 CopG family transcriptional regulator [Leptospira tipperaryensis]
MGILLLNSDHEIHSILQNNRMEVATLLVPKHTLLKFSEKERRNLSRRIPFLLKRYAKYLTSIKRLGRKAEKVLYQPSPGKEQMQRINVRVSRGSWALLGLLAQVHGVSRCFLFNFLLQLDELGVGDSIVNVMNEGGPTFHRNYKYTFEFDLLNNRIKRSLKCEPEYYFYVLDYRDWFDS